MLTIPVLETRRLRLRGHCLEDFQKMSLMWADPAVTRYLGIGPQTTEEAWSRFLRYSGHWAILGFGYWLVEEKHSGDFVGEVGFSDYKRDLKPALEQIPEIGWVLTPAKHRLGYATEAVKAVLQWGAENLKQSEVFCIIHPDHQSSIKVAEKCGFATREPGMYRKASILVLRRTLRVAGQMPQMD